MRTKSGSRIVISPQSNKQRWSEVVRLVFRAAKYSHPHRNTWRLNVHNVSQVMQVHSCWDDFYVLERSASQCMLCPNSGPPRMNEKDAFLFYSMLVEVSFTPHFTRRPWVSWHTSKLCICMFASLSFWKPHVKILMARLVVVARLCVCAPCAFLFFTL